MKLFPNDKRNDFKAFGKEGEEWLNRFAELGRKESELYDIYGVDFFLHMGVFLNDNMPDFPSVHKFLDDQLLDDELLVLLIPIMEDGIDNFMEKI